MYTGFSSILYTLFIVLISNGMGEVDQTRAVQLHSPFTALSLPKELLSNSILLAHLEARLMITASERDFALKASANSTFQYLRYPHSYRATLLQASSATHGMLTNGYSTIDRMQLDMKRIPGIIKTILKIITQGSPTIIERMLPTAFNSIARISDENEVTISKHIDQLMELDHLFEEIRTGLTTQPSDSDNPRSDQTDLTVNSRFDSKNAFEKICTMLRKMKNQFEQLTQLIGGLNIRTAVNLTFPVQTACLISLLYTLEFNAHFLYQFSNVYTHILHRYLLAHTAGMAKYLILSTNEERSTMASGLTQQVNNAMHALGQSLIERQSELQSGDMLLRDAYAKLFDQFPQENCEKTNK